MLSTIQSKYIFSIIMVVMIFLLGLLVFNYTLLKSHSIAQGEETSSLILNSSDAQLNQIFSEIESLLYSLSVVDSVMELQIESMLDLFSINVMVKSEYIRSLFLGTVDGQMYAWGIGEGFINNRPVYPSDYDPRERPWYKNALDKSTYVLTEPYVFASVDALGITAVFPVYDNKKLLGVLGLDLILPGLDNAVNSLTIQRGGKIILLDEGHHILASQFSPHDNSIKNLEIFPYPELVLKDQGFSIELFQGKKYLVSSIENGSTGWTMLLFLPYGEIMDFSQQNLKMIIKFDIFLVFLLGLLIAGITRKLITAPLDKIIHVLHHFDRGDTSSRIPSLPGKEFKLIGRLFNRFSDLNEESSRKMEEKVKARTKAVMKLQQENIRLRIIEEKERIYGNIHDSLGARITSINISNNVAKSAWERGESEVLKEMLEWIEKNTQQAIVDLKEILVVRSEDDLNQRDFLTFVEKGVRDRLALKEIKLETQLPEKGELSLLDPDLLRDCEKLLQEMVSNTLKHSKAFKAKLEIVIEQKKINIKYSDDGKGFTLKDSLNYGFGLQGLYSRAERMGGILKIVSRIDKGTIFEYSFKKGEL